MANERDNEQLVRDRLRELGYTAKKCGITVDEQAPKKAALKRLLEHASKTGGGGRGNPEFIITKTRSNVVLVIECKASTKDHASASLTNPVKYAADGALHYAKFLSKSYTVVAIASSGETADNWRVSTYVHRKGELAPTELTFPNGNPIDHIAAWDDYEEAVNHDPTKVAVTTADLLELSKEIHNLIRVKISESHKALLIAGTLIALKHDQYRAAILEKTSDADSWNAAREWKNAVAASLEDEYGEGDRKAENIKQQLNAIIDTNPSLCDKYSQQKKYRHITVHKGTALDTVSHVLASTVYDELSKGTAFDIIGAFYGQFLSYSNGDGKLGIVLTPQHITDLMCELAGVNGHTSIVLDPCTGTGGFLIAAMNKMFSTPGADLDYIKKHRLVGIEKRSDMYALAASNMLLRGDGKSNLMHGDCFDPDLIETITSRTDDSGALIRPNIGIINPPYGVDGITELRFIINMLDTLTVGGIGVAIVPMSAATASSKDKADLMAKHTLLAVMTLPKVFKGTGVDPCLMVFRARTPHNSAAKSWFSVWTDDGHEVQLRKGRQDTGRWAAIREEWLTAYAKGTGAGAADVPGVSVSRTVGPSDEWVAEAYLETDYSALTQDRFEKVVLDYALYLRENGMALR